MHGDASCRTENDPVQSNHLDSQRSGHIPGSIREPAQLQHERPCTKDELLWLYDKCGLCDHTNSPAGSTKNHRDQQGPVRVWSETGLLPRYNRGSMQMILSDRQVSFIRLICIAILLGSAGCYVLFTIHWPWMWDTQVFHYAVFLMKHGKIAYKDIYDINMPGCYLMERWAIDIFGGGDLGWRFYEFTLLGSMTLAACVIALPYDWLAGLLTGVLFAIFHGIDGAAMATERDEVIAVLILVGYAFQFLAIRRSRSILMLPFGLSLGMAVLIKPTAAAFAVVLLVFAYFALRCGQNYRPVKGKDNDRDCVPTCNCRTCEPKFFPQANE